MATHTQDRTDLADGIAAALLDCALCVYCLSVKTSASARQVIDALPAVQTVFTLRVTAFAPCSACGSRRGVTYSFSPAGAADLAVG